MTEKQTIQWILTNLGPDIDKALAVSKQKNPDLLYTIDWLAGMCYRETGFLINRYVTQGISTKNIHSLMRGDYGQRKGEVEKSYHGFGYWQIDIGSYPDFVKSGDWIDPYKTCIKAISVLEEKRLYLVKQLPTLTGEPLHRAIIAAYNCGQGRVSQAIKEGKDVDYYTHQKDYSKMVWVYRNIAKAL